MSQLPLKDLVWNNEWKVFSLKYMNGTNICLRWSKYEWSMLNTGVNGSFKPHLHIQKRTYSPDNQLHTEKNLWNNSHSEIATTFHK